MKFLVVFASVILAINAATDQELWLEFKETHAREYRNIREEQLRFGIFQDNLRQIETHNAKYDAGDVSYFLGVTEFADLSDAEFLARLSLSESNRATPEGALMHEPSTRALPTTVNWLTKGVVSGVKDQGSCGSCWSFSATGALEGQYALKHGTIISLSEQNLMDCSVAYGNNACNGGLMEHAYSYVHDYGIELESDYPYTARKGTCQYVARLSKTTVKNYYTIAKKNENALQDAVANVGPVSVAVNGTLWKLYKGGIFDDASCSQSLNHGVLAVGYGTEGKDYWLIKNSWGKNWGENGYIRLVRNKANQCGIVSDATYPTLN